MNIIITGSTGMIGKGVLLECLDNPTITSILLVNRTPINIKHPKLTEIICADWLQLSDIEKSLTGYDACYFCLGATVSTLSEASFRHTSITLSLHFIKTILNLNPNMTLCTVTGMGVDGSKPTKNMWMGIKGEQEQALVQLNLNKLYIFRPGYIQPMRGVRSKTMLYRLFYLFLSPFYPIIKRLLPTFTTSTVEIGKAMIYLTKHSHNHIFLENNDINKLANGLA